MMLSIDTEHGKFISMNCINTEITFEFIIPVRPVRNIRLLQFNCNEGLYRWVNFISRSNYGIDLESDKGGFRCKLSDIDDVDFWRD